MPIESDDNTWFEEIRKDGDRLCKEFDKITKDRL
jgi:hypothetical protein